MARLNFHRIWFIPAKESLIARPQALSADQYFDRLLHWLDLESDAEKVRLAQRRQLSRGLDAERSGETIIDLVLSDHRTGLGGRYLLSFAKRRQGLPLPWNRLKVGSPVVVSNNDQESDEGTSGVVSRRNNNVIEVAVEQWPGGDRFRIDMSPDETTRRRQRAAIGVARNATGRPAKLRDMLLGPHEPRFDPVKPIEFLGRLNPPQEDAVRFALSARDFAIIHGPPGTGKTTTLVEIIRQAVVAGQRVLACASSNTAVDNLLERLVRTTPHVVRVGHPARVIESLREHTLDELVREHESTEIVRELMRESETLMRQAARSTRSREAYRRAGEMRSEARMLQNQARSLERQAIQYVLDAADVTCTTTTIDDDLLGSRRFDLVVIDEACQSTEAGIWQAILRAERVVFAGDHCQLPPTVLSDIASRDGMKVSLMERLVNHLGADVYRRLTVQYRMHDQIMRFSSDQFYDGSLIADVSVASHRLVDLPGVQQTPFTERPATFIDTAGAEYDEAIEPDGLSKLNPREANLVTRIVRQLTDAGISGDQIAVIVPYAAQVRLLRSRLNLEGLEIDTVDGFQGREKEVVIISLVRSNDKREIGFLADTRRTNVALTRARRSLIVIGDSATFASNPFYAAMFEYFESIDAYDSVWNFTDWDNADSG
ncbi:MAG: AAA domain-containing protein [Planctomycetaceae bacterium]